MNKHCMIEVGDLVKKLHTKNTRSSVVTTYGVCQNYNLNLNTAVIAWHPSGRISEENLFNLETMDRQIVPGDFVCCNRSGRIGYVKNVIKSAAVEIKSETDMVVVNIDSRRLKHPKLLLEEKDFVLFKNEKMAVVIHAHRRVRLSYFPEKPKKESFFLKQEDIWIDWDVLESYIQKDTTDPFFRHNMFYVGLDLKNVNWNELKKSPIPSMSISDFLSAKITLIEIDKLTLQWVNKDESIVTESELGNIDLKNIRRLNLFEYTKVYIGSIRMLRLKKSDQCVTRKEWDQKDQATVTKRKVKSPSSKLVAVEVLSTETDLLLVWLDDGKAITAKSYNFTRYESKIKLYPGLSVLYDNANGAPVEGIIKTVDLLKNTITVGKNSIAETEEVSMYDIVIADQNLLSGAIIIYDRNWNNWEETVPDVMLAYVVYTKLDGTMVTILDTGEESCISDLSIVYRSTVCHFRNRDDDRSQPKVIQASGPIFEDDSCSSKGLEWTFDDYLDVTKYREQIEMLTEIPSDHPYRNAPANFNTTLKERMKDEFRGFDEDTRMEMQKIRIKVFIPRADLYSIMIVGPQRTPYADFLFFFDVYLPQNYPMCPPIIHYRATKPFGLINPLLLPDGTVDIPIIQKTNWTLRTPVPMLHEVFNFIIRNCLISVPCVINQLENHMKSGLTIISAIKSFPFDIRNKIFNHVKAYNEAVMLNLFKMADCMIKHPSLMWKKEIRKHFEDAETKVYFNQLLKHVSEIPYEDKWTYPGGFPILPLTNGGRISITKCVESILQCMKNE